MEKVNTSSLSSAVKLSISAEFSRSAASPLNDSNSLSLPSEYYVPTQASVNSQSISPEWSSVASSVVSSQNDSTAVTIHSPDTSLTEQTCCDYISFTPRRFKASSKFRKCPHTLPLLLVYYMFLLLGFIERGSFLVLFYSLNSYDQFTPPQMEAVYLGVRGFVYLMYPVVGFISDTYFGQYKVIFVCLNIVWLGSALLAAGFTKMDPIFDTYYDDGIWSAGSVALIAIGYLIMGSGLAGIKVNLIPFGVDQIPDASSGELSSYFHWYYWCLVVGQLLATLILPYIYVQSFLSYVFLLMNTFVTVFITILVLSAPKLQIHSKIGNPLRLVVNVTHCALTMRKRRPAFRSAFHVGKPLPTMMDKAMTEYGGMHSVEQVEDVKTFYRILFILVSFIGYFAIFSQIETTTIFQGSRLRQPYTSNCTLTTMERLAPYVQWYTSHFDDKIIQCSFKSVPSSIGYAAANLLPLLILIPLFDRVLYVCLNGWKWFSMLGRIGIGKAFILVSITWALIVEIARQSFLREEIGRTSGTIQINAVRYHTEQADSLHVASDISVYWVWPQYILFSFARLFCNITAVEFIYAQSPRAMKGLLLGLFFATQGVSMLLSSLLMLILDQLPKTSFCSYFANTRHFYRELLTNGHCMRNSTFSTAVINSTTALHEEFEGCMDSAICAYIIFVIVAIGSTVFFTIGACRYKLRKRDRDPEFPFWLYPETQKKKKNVCLRAVRFLCFCVKDKDWQI